MTKKDNIIYGIWPVIEAMKSGKEIEKVLIHKGLRGEGFHQLHSHLKELEIPFQFVPPEKLNRLTRQNHQGVVAYISEISYQKLESVIPFAYEHGKVPLLVLLDHITDVRNLGAIARTAECAGVDGILLPEKGSAQVNQDAIKTSAGALYKLPVIRYQDSREAITFMKNSGLKIIAATEKAGFGYTQADMTKPMALILGAEDTGISDDLIKMADELVMIPVMGEIQSLNVSVAAGVILYEILRQRKLS
jgi:23S rRNA (guanosine2251-2'-O)-methyltransferase